MTEHVTDQGEINALTHDSDCDGEDCLGTPPDCIDGLDHRWVGVGGIDTNPGVWSLGGTAFRWDARCIYCGCGRHVIHHGHQRNPGKCDSIDWRGGEYKPDDGAAREELRRLRRNRTARLRRIRLDPAFRAGGELRGSVWISAYELVREARRARRAEQARQNFTRKVRP
jgi:hypothetical protein